MPVPTLITDLSQTAASNFPQGTDSPSLLDDVQRAHASFIAMLRDGVGSAFLTPSGTVLDFAGAAAPAGYLVCNGAAVSRTTYSALFTAIGTAWGAGDGSTTFNVPDLQGRATIGSGTGSGLSARTLAQKIGEENHVLTTAELAAHNHTINISDPTHSHTMTAAGIGVSSGPAAGTSYNLTDITSNRSTLGSATGITASSVNTGSGTGHNTMQPSAVVQKIIKT